jgi:hypothetical protein
MVSRIGIVTKVVRGSVTIRFEDGEETFDQKWFSTDHGERIDPVEWTGGFDG